MSNVLYVVPKDEAHMDMLVEHYEFLGYYVKKIDGRLQISSRKPAKPKRKNDEEKRTGRNSDRDSRDSRNGDSGERRSQRKRDTR